MKDIKYFDALKDVGRLQIGDLFMAGKIGSRDVVLHVYGSVNAFVAFIRDPESPTWVNINPNWIVEGQDTDRIALIHNGAFLISPDWMKSRNIAYQPIHENLLDKPDVVKALDRLRRGN